MTEIRDLLTHIVRRLQRGRHVDDQRRWFEEYMADVRAGRRAKPPRGILYVCSCCGYPTQDGVGKIYICPLCSWNDLGRWEEDEDDGWVRKYTLEEARNNFSRYLTSYSPDDDRFSEPELKQKAKRAIMQTFNAMPGSSDAQLCSLWRTVDQQMVVLDSELNREAQEYIGQVREMWKERFRNGTMPDGRPRKKPETPGEPKIHLAAAAGDLEAIQQILSESPDQIELRNHYGETPLYVAVDHYQVEVVRLLLEKGADPDGKNKKGYTPLWWAAAKCSDQMKIGAIAELLIAAGADVNDKDNDLQWPPMAVAIREANDAVRAALRRHGARGG